MANPYSAPSGDSTTSGAPVVRRIAWLALALQFGLMFGLSAAGWYVLQSPRGAYAGLAIFVAYVMFARLVIGSAQRRGMRFVRRELFEQAIPAFKESYEFFTKHAWLDRYRALTMLSASAMSYREMALCNIAFCNTQIGNGREAKSYYQRALVEFPQCGMAASALRMIDTIERSAAQSPSAASDDNPAQR
jgi:hypothetical protein